MRLAAASTEVGARAPNLGCEAAAAPAALRARRGATLFAALGARLGGGYVALACGGVAARAQSHWLRVTSNKRWSGP